MDKADACNARIYLEATIDELPAYVKYGWEMLEEVVLDYAMFGGAGSQMFVLMLRQPRRYRSQA